MVITSEKRNSIQQHMRAQWEYYSISIHINKKWNYQLSLSWEEKSLKTSNNRSFESEKAIARISNVMKCSQPKDTTILANFVNVQRNWIRSRQITLCRLKITSKEEIFLYLVRSFIRSFTTKLHGKYPNRYGHLQITKLSLLMCITAPLCDAPCVLCHKALIKFHKNTNTHIRLVVRLNTLVWCQRSLRQQNNNNNNNVKNMPNLVKMRDFSL